MQAGDSTFRPARVAAWLIGIVLLAASGLAVADPPARVARLGYLNGTVSFNAAGDDEWVQASLNRPLTTGDRLWADNDGRAEVQAGAAVVRLRAGTDLSLLNFDDRNAQLQLTQGVLDVRLRRSAPDQVYEIDTPNLALTLRQPAALRIEVDADGNATSVFVRSGQVEVYGEGASYVLDAQHPYRFTGTGLREYEAVQPPPPDEFAQWASDRDRAYDRAAATRYVSPDVVGYEDLDAHGTWQAEPSYGYVWVPNRVSADWAPYREGHWAWVEPWGWTWIDDAPWGFAVTHYGRWAHVRNRWCWVPGPVQARPYYAPALVAFVGGDNFSLTISSGSVGGVAWFPLAPREVYRPAYAVSRTYYERVNVTNTVVNTTVINNTYNTTNVTNVVYANRKVPGAVVAVPQTAFVQSQPVARQAVRVPEERLVARPVAVAPAVAPTERSVRGRAQAASKPPATAIERAVVAREAPPARQAKFEPSKQAPAARTDDARKDRKDERPATQGPKPNVKVIARQDDARPQAAPPPAAAKPGGAADKQEAQEARGRDDAKGPSRPMANAPERRAPDEQRGNERDEQRNEQRNDARNEPPQRDQRDTPEQGKPSAPKPPQQAARPPESRPQDERTAPDERARQDERIRAAQEKRNPRDKVDQRDQRDRRDQRDQPDQRERAQSAPRPPAVTAPSQGAPRPPTASPPTQAKAPESPPSARPAPPPPAEARRPDRRDRAEPPAAAPRPAPQPQAKVNPPAQDAPRANPPPQPAPRARPEPPRAQEEAPRPRAEASRPALPQTAPPAPRAEPQPRAAPVPRAAPAPRSNERKKDDGDRGEKK